PCPWWPPRRTLAAAPHDHDRALFDGNRAVAPDPHCRAWLAEATGRCAIRHAGAAQALDHLSRSASGGHARAGGVAPHSCPCLRQMNITDRFRHDRSAYERPTLGWRCGRAASWDLPCKRGPTASGVCRGQDACKPARGGEAWQCRRPAAEGGPCANGPDKDGVCGLHRPPCAPRRTFRIWRGRLTALAIGATVALVALLALETDLVAGRPSSLDP